MRRILSILLLLVLGFGPDTPATALASGLISGMASGWSGKVDESSLPACCRRNGKHHCAMIQMMEDDPGTTQASAPSEKCPFFPHTWQATQVENHFIAPGVAGVVHVALQSQPACHAQIEAQLRISFDRSRQKRGPPATTVAS
jgi:hypothetical protein